MTIQLQPEERDIQRIVQAIRSIIDDLNNGGGGGGGGGGVTSLAGRSGAITLSSGALSSNVLKIQEPDIVLSDNLTNDSSTVRHGFLKKLSGSSIQFLNGVGDWAIPPSSGGTGAPLCINIMDYGGNNAGTADNDTAFNNCWSALGSKGGCIFFPAGTYNFAAKINKTFPNAQYSVSIYGAGDGVTRLYWRNSDGGMQFNYTCQGLGNNLATNNMTFDGLTFVTGQSSGGYGLWLRYPTGTYQEFWLPTRISNCSFVGLDMGYGSNKYWTQCNRIEAVNAVKWTNCFFSGALLQYAIQSGGTGVYLGAGGGDFGVLYDFHSCIWNTCDIGLVYGPGIQGVTVNQCNFNGQSGTVGIKGLNDGGYLLAQLCVSNSQFDCGQFGITTESVIYDFHISNCPINISKSNGACIKLGGSNKTTIMGCAFQTQGSPSNVTGVSISGDGVASIVANSFADMEVGFVWDAGTNRCFSQANQFSGVAHSTYNFGSSLTPGTPHE